MTDPTKPTESPLVVPLLPDSQKSAEQPVPSAPKGMGVWYALRTTTIIGVVFFVVGLGIIRIYLTTDKEHLHETIVLWIGVGFVAAGWHLISRQSVKNFMSDFGRVIPFGKKEDGSDGGGG